MKIAADVQPVPSGGIPGTPFHPAIFEDMSAVPYVRDGWVSYPLWAREMRSAPPAPGSRTTTPDKTGGAPDTPASKTVA